MGGAPDTVSNENPQAEEVSIIDVENGKKTGSISLGRVIFSVNYLKDGISAYIESGYGAAVISESNRIKYLEPSSNKHPKLEQCPPFSGKFYSKWNRNSTPLIKQK